VYQRLSLFTAIVVLLLVVAMLVRLVLVFFAPKEASGNQEVIDPLPTISWWPGFFYLELF